ncbi:MAG: TraR/DksA family transcriptional regulator [Patescibacteria group bacterium]
MDQQFEQELRAKLKEQQDTLTAQLEEITHEKKFNKDKVQVKWQNVGDKDEDNAVEVANFQDSVALERNLEISLEKIETALKKMDEGTYGQCEKCGNPMEDDRLLAYPEATHCIKCSA